MYKQIVATDRGQYYTVNGICRIYSETASFRWSTLSTRDRQTGRTEFVVHAPPVFEKFSLKIVRKIMEARELV